MYGHVRSDRAARTIQLSRRPFLTNAHDVIIEPFAYPMLYDAWLAPA